MKSEIDLRAALRAVQDRELEELEQTSSEAHAFSPRFERTVRDALRRNPRRPAVGSDDSADTPREVHQIMEKQQKANRNRWIGVAAAAAVVVLLGALWLMPRGRKAAPAAPGAAGMSKNQTQESGAASTETPATEETESGWKIEKNIEPEVQAAIDAGESCMFWKVDDQIPNTGTLSNWTFEPFDCRELWPDLRAAVFPDAVDVKPMLQVDEAEALRYYLEVGDKQMTVYVTSLGITIDGELDEEKHRQYHLTQKQLLEYTEKIKAYLEERTGLELVEWDGLIDGERPLKDYTLVLDGNPVDPNADIPVHCSLAAWSSSGHIDLCVPIKSIARKESVRPDASLLSEDIRETAEFVMREYPPEWTVVDVFRDCSLNYGIDPDAHTIRPILSVTGRRYVVIKQQNGEMYSEIQSLNYQFDAVSGELIGGVHGI